MNAVKPAAIPLLSGQNLRAFRALRGMTQAELAKAAGMSQSAVAEFEAGKRDLVSDTLRRVCEVLDVKVQYVINETIFTAP